MAKTRWRRLACWSAILGLLATACGSSSSAIVDDGRTTPVAEDGVAPPVTAAAEPTVPTVPTAPTPEPTAAATPTAAPTPSPTPGPPDPPDLTKSPSVFFAAVPSQPVGANLPLPDGAVDFLELFEPGAAWDDAAAQIDGFKLHSWMVRHYLSDDDLRTIYAGLRDRDIPLVIEAEPLDPPDPAECDHTESFEGPFEIENLERLKRLDIEVAMIAIEQPFSFGHRLQGPGACRYEVSRVVDEVVAWIAQAREIYPDIPVGSIEAVWSDPLTSADDFALWLDSYEQASGEHFAFINIDPNFNWSGWGEVALGIEQVADARGIPFGILYNGNISRTNDEYLLEIAREFAYYENELGGTPDQVWIQSWHALPDRLLPDDDVTAMTSLINRYFGDRVEFEPPEIAAGEDGGLALTGRLLSGEGTPLVGKTVEVQALPGDGPRQSIAISGSVPGGAGDALVAVRVNAEDADPGDTKTTLYSVQYHERSDGSNLVPNGDFAAGLGSWGVYGEPLGDARAVTTADGPAVELTATEAQQIWIDGAQFPVTSGADFEFTVEFGSPAGTAGTVTVAVIFLDVSESSRSTIVLGPQPVGDGWTVQTDAAGRYTIDVDGLAPGLYDLAIRTDGDVTTWVASTTFTVQVFEL